MEFLEKGCVYFFRHIGLTPVKIGYSTNRSPINRFEQFKTYAPYGSEILGFIICDNPKELETRLHAKFLSKRLSGEWFDISEEEVLKEISFNSSIEDIRIKNEFEIAWAKAVNKEKSNDIKTFIELNKSVKDRFITMFNANNDLNRSKTSKQLGIHRKTIHNWIKEIKTGAQNGAQ